MSTACKYLHPFKLVRSKLEQRRERIQRELKPFTEILEKDSKGRLRPSLTSKAREHVEENCHLIGYSEFEDDIARKYDRLSLSNISTNSTVGPYVFSGTITSFLSGPAGYAVAEKLGAQSVLGFGLGVTGGVVAGFLFSAAFITPLRLLDVDAFIDSLKVIGPRILAALKK